MNAIAAASAALGTAGATTPQPRLVRAAHEFEAQMMKELMKPLNRGNALTGSDDDDDEDSGSAGALGEFAAEALGRALSEQGGFGIASSIVKQLSSSGNQNGTVPVTGKMPVNTVIKAAE
jgi:Rod binding domain-containing protein